MVRAATTGLGPRRFYASILVLAAFGLAACDGAGSPREASRAGSGLELTAPTTARAIERDVPAPEVFDVSESGLWDGRPSLGGVWVAHPTARDPERVVIRNPQSGAEVIGALFRRERENPGPRFQISSEAAQALGILAGQPAVISVTALRLQRIESARPAPAEAAPETEALAAAAEADPAAEPAPRRGLFRRAAAEPAEAPAPEFAAAPAPLAPAGAPDGTVEITAIDPEPETRRGLRGLFRRQAQPEAEPGIAATTLDPVAPVVQTAAAPMVALPAPAIEPRPATGVPMAATALLAEPGVVPPAAQPEERRGLRGLFRRQPAEAPAEPALIPIPDAPAAAPAPAPVAVAAVAPAATGPRPDRAFVQIGIFSVEGNATRAQAQMRAAGLPAEIRQGRAGEREFWRVVVGPAADAQTQAQNLRRVQGLGFADAYTVAR